VLLPPVSSQDVIIEKHVRQEDLELRQGDGSVKKSGSRAYCNLIERLQDLLEVHEIFCF